MKAMLRYMKYAALGLLGLIAILLLAGTAYQAIATRHDMARLGGAGELHAVNGTSLYIDAPDELSRHIGRFARSIRSAAIGVEPA